eukprot:2330757-Prymnesium_polylepis.1
MAPRPRWKRSSAGMWLRRRHLGGAGASASSLVSPGTRAGTVSSAAAGAGGAAGPAGATGAAGA